MLQCWLFNTWVANQILARIAKSKFTSEDLEPLIVHKESLTNPAREKVIFRYTIFKKAVWKVCTL